MRESGLKYRQKSSTRVRRRVSPHAGEWIEISHGYSIDATLEGSLPMRESGLKLQTYNNHH